MPCSVGSDVLELFLALAEIPSPSGEERAVADEVLRFLRELDLEPSEDDVGPRIGSQIGNVYCRVPATEDGGRPLFLCAHLDTVPPTAPVEPVVQNGIVTNANPTILGADNKAAVAAMLAAVQRLARDGIPHAGVEILLTPMEEVGLRGAKEFDVSRLDARFGYVYDHAAPIGHVVLAAPSQSSLDLTFKGRAAHSGIAPEDGRSAVAAAARAVAEMQLGRIDDETTANVGMIRGGVARNIVPPECRVRAEARSRDPGRLREVVQAMLDAAVYAANATECELDTAVSAAYESYRFTRASDPVRLASDALRKAGFEPTYIESGGGADANVFNAAGIPCVNLCNGMRAIHTADEQIAVGDLHAMVDVTLALVAEARGG